MRILRNACLISLILGGNTLIPAATSADSVKVETKRAFFENLAKIRQEGITNNPQELIEAARRSLDERHKDLFGLSVQDLIDNKLVPAMVWGELVLSSMYINDLSGLENLQKFLDTQAPQESKVDIATLEMFFEPADFENFKKQLESEAQPTRQELQSLILNHNQITEIPKNLFLGFTNLQYLQLQHNKIAAVAPNAFAGLTNLITLSLSDNFLTEVSLGMFAGLDSLKTLALSGNPITAIVPGALANLHTLEQLIMQNNQLAEIIQGTFNGLDNLEKIYLENSLITTIDPSAFADLKKLIALYLDRNNIADPAKRALLEKELKVLLPNANITV